MSNHIKQIRGQVRQVIKEMLPEILTEQLVEALGKRLAEQLAGELTKIDSRQADLQSYLVRNAGVPNANKKSE